MDTDEPGSLCPRPPAADDVAGQTADLSSVSSSEGSAKEEGHSDCSRHESQTAQINAKPVRPREVFARKRDSGSQ
jgi:hypothetical protein